MAIEFPDKLAFLFEPHRYKVARGGRGSSKSWSFARALLILGAQKPMRILCTREIQKSIADSVHKLLADQIVSLSLSGFYDVQQAYIKGRNGTEFSFAGLQQHTVDSIKSYEGVDIVWIEEAHAVVKKSWDVLLPTIRKPESEIWVSYNPQLESDETHQRFVIKPPPDCMSVLMNYNDNPWFPAVLEQERLHAQATMKPEQYAHIWEGKCMPAVEGAIYFEQMSQAESRISNVPHDGLLKTHVIFDLGWNDAMTIILAQKVAGEIRIIHYIEGHQRTLAEYSAELKGLDLDGQPINWGHVYLPHDGYHKRHQSGKSDAEVMQQLGWSVMPVPNMHVEQGINRVREVFPRTYFNRDRTARLVECLKRYRRQINQQTNEPGAPLHDEYSHGADVMRYLAVVSDQLSNDEWGGQLNYRKLNNA
ncbi:PBSX family phage terminase large subunit [Pseudomonas sp. COR58]|uniref:PBSX family phage terminase large subunit n=1 Tax=Pseudomonas ekonensis TaxID=2842353 RepID=A0ABS6PG54_9PSED|nr:PBSX family phage terminase large subunit [Pseudomonas ekonensis]MBV4459184.1 PBSX family phage terminase large subunit [Pseudomonas ekonensis]